MGIVTGDDGCSGFQLKEKLKRIIMENDGMDQVYHVPIVLCSLPAITLGVLMSFKLGSPLPALNGPPLPCVRVLHATCVARPDFTKGVGNTEHIKRGVVRCTMRSV